MATTTLERPATALRNAARRKLTFAEYMEIEREAETKHDLVQGVMIDVAGGTSTHGKICANVITWLNVALLDTVCSVMTSDVKVYIGRHSVRYPDVCVACGTLDVAFGESLQNPVLLVEVLSDSTEKVDRGIKAREYAVISSLRHYVLIGQNAPLIEHYERDAAGDWTLTREAHALTDTWRFDLGGVVTAIPLSRVYRLVDFPTDDTEGA